LVAGGCVDGFHGSNVQIDFRNFVPPMGMSPGSSEFPVQATVAGTPAAGELPANTHFTLYAVPDPGIPTSMIELTNFEVHRLVDPTSPCFIDVGEHVPHAGLHVTEFAHRISEDTGITDIAHPPATATEQQKIEMATALQREDNIKKIASDLQIVRNNQTITEFGIRAITSASTSVYPAVATDCSGTPDRIPPAICIDDASNALRLQLCQKAWDDAPDLYEGTDRVITTPLNGRIYGLVDGENPVNESPVGGATFFLDNPLVNIGGYAIYNQIDGVDGPGRRIVGGNVSPTAGMPTRGVTHVTLVGAPLVAGQPPLVGLMAVFSDLGQDDVHF
jgi:hypothetical protein